VGADGLRHSAVLDALLHELEHRLGLRRVDRRLFAVVRDRLAAGAVEQLEEVHGEALVARSLVDEVPVALRVLVDLLPGLRRLLHLVGAVVEEACVRVERNGPVLVVELGAVDGRADELVLVRVHPVAEVVDPALRGVLGGPDRVYAEHVALARLGPEPLHLLGALIVGRGRQLDQLHLGARVLVVEELDHGRERAGRVLADAPADVALRVLRITSGERLVAPAAAGAAAATAPAAAGREGQRGHHDRECDYRPSELHGGSSLSWLPGRCPTGLYPNVDKSGALATERLASRRAGPPGPPTR